jgi:hypothetical protein
MVDTARLEELREKLGRPNPFKTTYEVEKETWEERWENTPERIEYRKDLARWNELTKDWSEEDREWAWRFIAGASAPRA